MTNDVNVGRVQYNSEDVVKQEKVNNCCRPIVTYIPDVTLGSDRMYHISLF